MTPGLSAESQKKVSALIKDIDKTFKQELDKKKKKKVKALRKTYNSFSDQEKAAVTNYKLLTDMEKTISQLSGAADDKDADKIDSTTTQALNGTPVYYASNLHAGKEFYLNSLQENYQLSFSDDFADVMEQIETEYKAANQLTDVSDSEGGVTTSADTLLVRNWQDILAIYVYEKSLDGATSFTLDSSCKDDLAAIFARMNKDRLHQSIRSLPGLITLELDQNMPPSTTRVGQNMLLLLTKKQLMLLSTSLALKVLFPRSKAPMPLLMHESLLLP